MVVTFYPFFAVGSDFHRLATGLRGDQLGGGERPPPLGVRGGQVAYRGEVRQLRVHGTGAGGKHRGPFGGIKKRELAETGQGLRLVSRLLRGTREFL